MRTMVYVTLCTGAGLCCLYTRADFFFALYKNVSCSHQGSARTLRPLVKLDERIRMMFATGVIYFVWIIVHNTTLLTNSTNSIV